MALNIAVPISGVDDLLDELKQLSPASPLNFKDCQLDGRKISCSPNGSESSGISSLDSEEIKKSSTSSSPIEEHGPSIVGSSVEGESPVVQPKDTINNNDGNTTTKTTTSTATSDQIMSPRPKHAISDAQDEKTQSKNGHDEESEDTGVETDTSNDEAKKSDEEDEQMDATETTSTPSPSNEPASKDNDDYYSIEEQRRMIASLRIVLNGRNILELGANLQSSPSAASANGFVTSAELPANNLKMFLANRSQYHRLGANGHIQEYALAKCTCCDLIYPVSGNGNNIYNNANGSANVMTNDSRTVEENSLSAGVLAYLKSATNTVTNTTGPASAPNNGSIDLFGGSATGFGAGFGGGSYHNEYNSYFGNGATTPIAAAANKYNNMINHNNNYQQPAAAVVNALLNTKEPNFNNTNINYSMNNGKNLYNASNLNMTALNRILNSGNATHAAAAAAAVAAAFNGNGNINSVVGNQNSIESLAAALLSQNIFNAATTAAAAAVAGNQSCNNNNSSSNKYHPIHNQHHHHHNQHHKMSPPQNNYGYYKQF